MKMDNQNRIIIPVDIREKFSMEGVYYLIFKTKENITFSKEEKDKVIGKTKVDIKGRFVIPKNIINSFNTENMLIYYEDDEVGILFLNEDA